MLEAGMADFRQAADLDRGAVEPRVNLAAILLDGWPGTSAVHNRKSWPPETAERRKAEAVELLHHVLARQPDHKGAQRLGQRLSILAADVPAIRTRLIAAEHNQALTRALHP
eukprot:gnl/TRDRNA2_/TRDRNA2_127539_c0_seq1.p1 gnl/TRDRNA2_/TRDRNA2_127539_c0~~gnl/TRDRNA2_/TRDRNA2_127539_c0_seq1.p1  ORF type:complete len:112 (+),score=18.02 gnl/TRDRNA2_/TRDRNA2_127539_c0_seq1:77-412(+)